MTPSSPSCQGASGPVLHGVWVPVIMYAADVALITSEPRTVAQEAQGLLDVHAAFCRLLGMKVNMAPHKTFYDGLQAPRCACAKGL